MEDHTVFETDDGHCELDTYLLFASEWSAMEATYVVLDVEVTERMEMGGEIIGLQALLIRPNGVKQSELGLLVQSRQPAPDWLLEELKLDALHLAAHAIEEVEALRRLKDFAGLHPIFVHHAAFDLPFLHRAAARYGLEFSNPVWDTLAIAEVTWPGQRCSQSGLAQLLEQLHPQDQPLSKDAKVTWKVLLEARGLAQSVHAMHIDLREGAKLKPTKTASNGESVICPFCQVQHAFYP